MTVPRTRDLCLVLVGIALLAVAVVLGARSVLAPKPPRFSLA